MKKTSYHVLRIGLGVTFLWVGILIFKRPETFGGYIRTRTIELLPVSII